MRIETGGTPLSCKQFRAWKERKLVKIQDFGTYAGYWPHKNTGLIP